MELSLQPLGRLGLPSCRRNARGLTRFRGHFFSLSARAPHSGQSRGSRKPSGHNKGLTVKSPPSPVLEARRLLRPRLSLEPQPAVAGFARSRVSRLPPTSRVRGWGLPAHQAGWSMRQGQPSRTPTAPEPRPPPSAPSLATRPARQPQPVSWVRPAPRGVCSRQAKLHTEDSEVVLRPQRPGLLLPRCSGRRAELFTRPCQTSPPFQTETSAASPPSLGRELPDRKLRGLGARLVPAEPRAEGAHAPQRLARGLSKP